MGRDLRDEVAEYCSSAGCDHNECTEGAALAESCTECSATVCGYDPYCCTTAWTSSASTRPRTTAAAAEGYLVLIGLPG